MTMRFWLSFFIAALKAWLGIKADIHDREQQEVGTTKQQNDDLRADLAAQERINQADASAPTTDGEWNNAANRGEL
jgi:hypothetical protein